MSTIIPMMSLLRMQRAVPFGIQVQEAVPADADF